jgi:hypothetical protein
LKAGKAGKAGGRLFAAALLLAALALWLARREDPQPRPAAPAAAMGPPAQLSTSPAPDSEEADRARRLRHALRQSITSSPKPGIPAPVEPSNPVDPAADDARTYGRTTSQLVARSDGPYWVMQGDMLIDDTHLVPGTSGDGVALAEAKDLKFWDSMPIPYIIRPGVSRVVVIAAMTEMENKTVVRFTARTTQDDYVVFRHTDSDVCQSYLGRRGGEQEVRLGPACGRGQVLHELMHVLGFVHEQSRADRDDYLTIDWSEIISARKNEFQKLPPKLSMPAGDTFDFQSVLLYPSNAFSRSGKLTMTRKDGSSFIANRGCLSAGDVRRIEAIYGKSR